MALSPEQRAVHLRRERIVASPSYVDGRFRNVHPIMPGLKTGVPMPPVLDFFRDRPGKKPLAALPMHDPRADWQQPPESGLRATWLGHSTVLLEIDGARLLTDPVWSQQISPIPLLAPKRFHAVPVALSELPALDAVLISHDHFDHLDAPTIRALAKRDVPFITSLGVGALLAAWGVPLHNIHELDWWQSLTIAGGKLRVTATPTQHFSGRGLSRNKTLWSSFAVRGDRHALFFSGDTGLTTQFLEVQQRLGPFDLVMLEVGAFHPAWADIHLGPAHALTALSMLGGRSFLPIHWGTFDLALHAWDDPAEELLRLRKPSGTQLLMPKLGQTVEPTRHDAEPDPWWRAIAALEQRAPTTAQREAQLQQAEQTPQTLPVPLD